MYTTKQNKICLIIAIILCSFLFSTAAKADRLESTQRGECAALEQRYTMEVMKMIGTDERFEELEEGQSPYYFYQGYEFIQAKLHNTESTARDRKEYLTQGFEHCQAKFPTNILTKEQKLAKLAASIDWSLFE